PVTLGRARLVDATGDLARLVDGVVPPEGSAYDGPDAVVLSAGARATVDLGDPPPLGLRLVADGNDPYLVEASSDGRTFAPLWTAPIVDAPGLRTRDYFFNAPAPPRFVRVSPRAGDGLYSIAEIAPILATRSV